MRKAHQKFQRDRAKREPYDRVLIVCEGSKTEPMYLAALARHCRLNTANIEIMGAGADPLTIVLRAEKSRELEQERGEKYDRVYCIFDRDTHATFNQASQRARRGGLKLGRSWPCFEYWLLLHFRFTRSPYARTGERSPADNCILELKAHLPEYRKSMADVFDRLRDRLEDAKTNARRALDDAVKTGDPDPSTEMHKVVTYLYGIKEGE